MPEPHTLDDLRRSLQARADATTPPALPLADLADLVSAHRSRRRTTVAALVVAAVVIGVLVAVGLAGPWRTEKTAGPLQTPTPSVTPTSLADLPVGETPRTAYAEGSSVHIDGHTVNVGIKVNGLVQAGPRVVAWNVYGRVVALDAARPADDPDRVRVLGIDGGRGAVISPNGHWAAWVLDPVDLSVRVQSLDAPYETYDQKFPQYTDGPLQCCDESFAVDGITGQGELIASRPAFHRVWRWTLDQHSEDTLSPADGQIAELPVPRIIQVIGDTLVGSLDDGRGIEIGAASSVWEPDIRIGDSGYVATDSDRTRALILRAQEVFVVRLDSVSGADQAFTESVALRLPAGLAPFEVVWESADHVLVAVGEDAGTVLRCDTGTGACERTGVDAGRILLARQAG